MRIALFSDIYTPSRDGVRLSVEGGKHALEHAGHDVSVITAAVPGYIDHESGVIRLASVGNAITPTTAPSFRVAIPKPGLSRKLSQRLKSDIVHSHTQGTPGLIAYQVSKLSNVPLIHTVHGFMYEVARKTPGQMTVLLAIMAIAYTPFLLWHKQSLTKFTIEHNLPWRERWMLRYLLAIMDLADEFITPSPHVRDRLRSYGFTKPMHLIPSTIDQTDFRSPQKSNIVPPPANGVVRIVSVGRLSDEKRVQTIIEALADLPRDNTWDCIIVGDGHALETCQALVKRLDLTSNVIFVGSQPHEVVAQVMLESHVFVLASYHFDIQPLVIIEAICAGLPIVYCDELLTVGLTPQTAVKVDKSAAGLASGFTKLITDTKLREQMSGAALKLADDFQPSVTARQLADVYTDAIAAHSKA